MNRGPPAITGVCLLGAAEGRAPIRVTVRVTVREVDNDTNSNHNNHNHSHRRKSRVIDHRGVEVDREKSRKIPPPSDPPGAKAGLAPGTPNRSIAAAAETPGANPGPERPTLPPTGRRARPDRETNRERDRSPDRAKRRRNLLRTNAKRRLLRPLRPNRAKRTANRRRPIDEKPSLPP
mmetsp:Transcript_142/g.269  ORF Transcript_142/g.269 Transcript_142/m.269 type:complete len:178 (+) Transcript_142:833-1366(+)